ncbi:MAG: dihydropteroate synthase, partial [Tidjanibacter sp.]|nr:dihydropteroate synthase [Tidjanibacter sp.]
FSGGVENDFRLLGGLGEFARFGLPLLVGLSRKRLVWQSAEITAEEAMACSLALGWQALMGGATILRTHDVAPTKQLYKIFERYKALNR